MKAPERLYLSKTIYNTYLYQVPDPDDETAVEYTRTDAFIEKAAQFLYDYNQKQVLKHGARATLGCGEYTINVDKFRKYMKGEKA